MRDAPSLAIIPSLQREGALIRAYDPVSTEAAEEFLNDVDYVSTAYDAVARSTYIYWCGLDWMAMVGLS